MRKIVILFGLVCGFTNLLAQKDTLETNKTQQEKTKRVRVLKTDGGEMIGDLLGQDSHEVHFRTSDNREIYIPQHAIEKIEVLDNHSFNRNGDYIGDDAFSTRYFISANGLPLEKGESYILWNWWGADAQFGVGNDVGLGVMTTWIGAPIIGTIKKSWATSDNSQFAIGGLVGTGSYGMFDLYGGMPYASLSVGDSQSNFAISAGYGSVSYKETDYSEYDYEYVFKETRVWDNAGVISLAGLHKFTPKVSFVFESFFLLPQNVDAYGGIIIPGFRFQQEKGKAFQIGFAGAFNDQGFFPLPMLQWFRSF